MNDTCLCNICIEFKKKLTFCGYYIAFKWSCVVRFWKGRNRYFNKQQHPACSLQLKKCLPFLFQIRFLGRFICVGRPDAALAGSTLRNWQKYSSHNPPLLHFPPMNAVFAKAYASPLCTPLSNTLSTKPLFLSLCWDHPSLVRPQQYQLYQWIKMSFSPQSSALSVSPWRFITRRMIHSLLQTFGTSWPALFLHGQMTCCVASWRTQFSVHITVWDWSQIVLRWVRNLVCSYFWQRSSAEIVSQVYIVHLGSETSPSIGHINLSERHPDLPPVRPPIPNCTPTLIISTV